MTDVSSDSGCLLKIGDEEQGGEEDSVVVAEAGLLELEWEGSTCEVGSESSWDPSIVYTSPLRKSTIPVSEYTGFIGGGGGGRIGFSLTGCTLLLTCFRLCALVPRDDLHSR